MKKAKKKSSLLAVRLRPALLTLGAVEKRMFGGEGFLIRGNLCVAVWDEHLIARVGTTEYAAALQQPGAREFDVTGHAMRGWVMVQPQALENDDALNEWVQLAIQFVLTLPEK